MKNRRKRDREWGVTWFLKAELQKQPNLDWNKSIEISGKLLLKHNSKRLSWPRLSVWHENCFKCRSPFWSTNIMRPPGITVTMQHTGIYPRRRYAVHSSQGNRSRWDFFKIHKNILSSSKYKTQSVHNYTSLSCPNRARNVEYASTNYMIYD